METDMAWECGGQRAWVGSGCVTAAIAHPLTSIDTALSPSTPLVLAPSPVCPLPPSVRVLSKCSRRRHDGGTWQNPARSPLTPISHILPLVLFPHPCSPTTTTCSLALVSLLSVSPSSLEHHAASRFPPSPPSGWKRKPESRPTYWPLPLRSDEDEIVTRANAGRVPARRSVSLCTVCCLLSSRGPRRLCRSFPLDQSPWLTNVTSGACSSYQETPDRGSKAGVGWCTSPGAARHSIQVYQCQGTFAPVLMLNDDRQRQHNKTIAYSLVHAFQKALLWTRTWYSYSATHLNSTEAALDLRRSTCLGHIIRVFPLARPRMACDCSAQTRNWSL